MTEQRILQIFNETGALINGHFQLTSGLHSNQYFQCARVLQYPEHAAELCGIAIEKFAAKKPSVVIAPAVGGIVVGYETARQLRCRSIFAEREEGVMRFRRGFSLLPGDTALVVEDVVTTGGSVQEVVELAENMGAFVLGVFALVDRSGGRAQFSVPFESAIQIQAQTYGPATCPLCAKGVPISKPGSRELV